MEEIRRMHAECPPVDGARVSRKRAIRRGSSFGFVLCLLASNSLHAALSRQSIMKIFKEYERKNAEFVQSSRPGDRDVSQETARLRKAAEEYGEGPYQNALGATQARICKQPDAELMRALFRVILATSNSASESPAWALGGIFLCQAEHFSTVFKSLSEVDQAAIFETLEFGFENVVYGKLASDRKVIMLRAKLRGLAPPGVNVSEPPKGSTSAPNP